MYLQKAAYPEKIRKENRESEKVENFMSNKIGAKKGEKCCFKNL